jgi:hypothetical protein
MDELIGKFRSAGVLKESGRGIGKQLSEGIGNALKDAAADLPGIIENGLVNNASWGQIGLAIGTNLGAKIGKVIGGKIGEALGGAIGETAGALVAPLADALHRSAGEDVVRRVGHDWGVALTEEMGNAIADQAKTLFHGDRAAAEIFNLSKIIDVGGGLSGDNISRMTAKLRDTFSMLQTGMFSSAQAAQVLNENFGEFASYFEGGRISKELREIVRLTQEAGVNSSEITKFLQTQAGRARTGLEGVLAGSLRRKGGENDEDAKKFLPVSQEEFDRLSRLTTATFGAAIAAGQPFLDTLLAMTDSVGSLNEASTQFGFTQSAAFGDLSALQSFFAANEGIGQSIQGTNELLVALSNSNLLTQESFTDLGMTALDNFNEMTAGGLTTNQALLAQQDTLQTLWEIMQEGSLVVDDQTAALIEQAKEAGLVGEAHMDAQERATMAMEKAAVAMERVGDVLVQVFSLAGDEAENFAARATTAIESIPTEISFGVEMNPWSERYGPARPMTAGGYGTVSSPTLFAAGINGPEDYAFSGENRSFGSGDNGELVEEFRLLRSELRDQQRGQARVVRDELLTAPRR